MKLYITTTTLNIDNILSTECIAPYSFYKERKYGYNNFEKINQIQLKEITLLFSKIPTYSITDKEFNNYPLILEIDTNKDSIRIEKIDQDSKSNVDIYKCEDIIRLTPQNCKLLFFEEKAKKLAFVDCNDSSTNKLYEKFTWKICKGEFELSNLKIQKLNKYDKCHDFKTKIEKDNQFDRIKGFVFGYFIGIYKSLSTPNNELLNLRNHIYNLVASNRNSNYNSSKIIEEIKKISQQYTECYNKEIGFSDLWKEELERFELPHEKIDLFLKEYDKNNEIKHNFLKAKDLNLAPKLNSNDITSYYNSVDIQVSEIIHKERNGNLRKIDKNIFDLDPSYNTCMLSGMDEQSNLFNKFINFLLWHDIKPQLDDLRTNRLYIATELTKRAKSIWNENNKKWENSSAQIYMNTLRQHIDNYTPFDLCSIDNIILQSLAIYTLKGEDFDSIIHFCEENKICNYSYILSLWGATIGYTKIPRTKIEQDAFNTIYNSTMSLFFNYNNLSNTNFKDSFNKNYIKSSTFEKGRISEKLKIFFSKEKKVSEEMRNSAFQALDNLNENTCIDNYLDILRKDKLWLTKKAKPNTLFKRLETALKESYTQQGLLTL